MYSKILSKLLQEAFFPAFGIIVIKTLVSIFTLRSLNYNVDIYNLFNLQVKMEDYINVNSQVILFTLIFVFLGLLYSLSKSLFLHNSHISPKMSLSIFNMRIGFLIQDSFHLFSQTFIWLMFNFSVLFTILLLFILGLTPGYLLVLSFFFTVTGTYFFILDIEYEINSINLEDAQEVFIS